VTVALAIAGWCLAAAVFAEMRRRSGLLADAAHELRGPLTSISLGLESLRRQPAARRRADALLAELGRMHAAADDVAAAVRGGRAAGVPRSFEPQHVVERVSEAWRAPAARRGGRVLVDWQAAPGVVRADPRRLSQALGNLLANAVQHGGGEVIVRGVSSEAGLRIEVADRGSAAGASRSAPGRGRGLAIARRALVEAGGGLESRDRPGGGRIAIAELPVERVR
jgi:signal transduction histidine kinase